MFGWRNLVQFADGRDCQEIHFPLQLTIDRDIRQYVSHRSHAHGYLGLEGLKQVGRALQGMVVPHLLQVLGLLRCILQSQIAQF
jgi:hypothetical protein